MEIVYPTLYKSFKEDRNSIVAGMHDGNIYYDSLLEERTRCNYPDEHLPLNQTTFWYWREGGHCFDNPDTFFTSIPPVLSALKDPERVYIVAERSDLLGILRKLKHALPERIKEKAWAVPTIDTFWQGFFGRSIAFIDNNRDITLPGKILSTGTMGRPTEEEINGFCLVGEEGVTVKRRLNEISRVWDVPVVYL